MNWSARETVHLSGPDAGLQGFPEAAYSGMAEQLARKGHRVVVVEQVWRCTLLLKWHALHDTGSSCRTECQPACAACGIWQDNGMGLFQQHNLTVLSLHILAYAGSVCCANAC